MNKIIEKTAKANYENNSKFFNDNSSKFNKDEYLKYYAKLCEYEKIYDMYYWGFSSISDCPDYF